MRVGVAVGLLPFAVTGEFHADELGNAHRGQKTGKGVAQGMEIDAVAPFVFDHDAARAQVFGQRLHTGKPTRKDASGAVYALGLCDAQGIRQKWHQRNDRGFLALSRGSAHVDKGAGEIQTNIRPQQLPDFPSAQAGTPGDEVSQAALATLLHQRDKIIDGKRPPLEGLMAPRFLLLDIFKRVVGHAPLPHRPVKKRVGMPEILVARLGRQFDLSGPPRGELFVGRVPQELPLALLDESLQPVFRMQHMGLGPVARMQIADEILEVLAQGIPGRFSNGLGRTDAEKVTFLLKHQLFRFLLCDFFDMSAQRHLVNLRPVT